MTHGWHQLVDGGRAEDLAAEASAEPSAGVDPRYSLRALEWVRPKSEAGSASSGLVEVAARVLVGMAYQALLERELAALPARLEAFASWADPPLAEGLRAEAQRLRVLLAGPLAVALKGGDRR